jgi:outer membrane protein assembly factor BamB
VTARLPGYLMIADRDNNRIMVVSPGKRIVWRFPRPGDPPRQTFAGPDDAFLTPDRRAIITNEEFSDRVALLSLSRRPRILWEYGHQGAQGSGAGYLAHPDDAYVVAHRRVMVADIINCRVVWLNRAKRVVRTLGRAGDCTHDPPTGLLEPNGDTPLRDGGVLVTEIGGWVDRFDRRGRLRWSIRTPTDYPSDAQLLPDGDVLVAGFNTPGRVDILTPHGHVVWTYRRSAGPGALDRPSLAVAFPDGKIGVTDDWHHRVVVIDRRTKRIVWEYGHDGVNGRGHGYLNKPDGLQLIR